VKCAQVPRCAFFIEVRAFQFWLLLLLSPGPTSKWKTLHFCHLGFFRCSFITHQSTTTVCSRTLGSLVFRPRRPCDIIPLELGAFGWPHLPLERTGLATKFSFSVSLERTGRNLWTGQQQQNNTTEQQQSSSTRLLTRRQYRQFVTLRNYRGR
jgi:hypothetical protein